jgi:hypothetical protein
MDLRWLTASDHDVAAAMATVRRDSRPKWVPTRRQLLVHINHCLILWYLCVVFLGFGIQVDGVDDGTVSASVTGGLTLSLAILAVWIFGTMLLYRWAARPPSARARLGDWRTSLTALANGFEPKPSQTATFSSLISHGDRGVRQYPRFAAPGVEFGNLTPNGRRSEGWLYLAVTLPAPLPHFILDSTANNGVGSDLPAGIDRGQRITLEGDFDRWFRVYAPVKYGLEANYFFTPDVMAALIDDARHFNVEIVDNTLVFFTKPPADFTKPAQWESLAAILANAVPRLLSSAARYRDERVPGQETPPVIAKIRAEIEHPHIPWVAPPPRIGPNGRRLQIRDRTTGIWPVLGAIGWFATLAFLYAVPGIFAFAGFMSIVDGR